MSWIYFNEFGQVRKECLKQRTFKTLGYSFQIFLIFPSFRSSKEITITCTGFGKGAKIGDHGVRRRPFAVQLQRSRIVTILIEVVQISSWSNYTRPIKTTHTTQNTVAYISLTGSAEVPDACFRRYTGTGQDNHLADHLPSDHRSKPHKSLVVMARGRLHQARRAELGSAFPGHAKANARRHDLFRVDNFSSGLLLHGVLLLAAGFLLFDDVAGVRVRGAAFFANAILGNWKKDR